jgi:predicted adenylyl cyclase CyaB
MRLGFSAVAEYELRYRANESDVDRLLRMVRWSDPSRVLDLTFGRSGAESMQIDGWVLRLRRENDAVRLEFKSPLNSDWTLWNEVSVRVDSFGRAARILELIGLRPGLLLDRTRRTAVYGGVQSSLDQVADLGAFVELEVLDAVSEEEARRRIRFACSELGLGADHEPAPPYGELLLRALAENPVLKRSHDERIRVALRDPHSRLAQ